MTQGPSNGKIIALVSWKDCVDPVGVDFVEVEITIRPINGAVDGSDDIKKSLQKKSVAGAVLNAAGSWAPEFSGLTSGDTVVKAEVWVFPKVMAGQLQNNMAYGPKNVSVVVP